MVISGNNTPFFTTIASNACPPYLSNPSLFWLPNSCRCSLSLRLLRPVKHTWKDPWHERDTIYLPPTVLVGFVCGFFKCHGKYTIQSIHGWHGTEKKKLAMGDPWFNEYPRHVRCHVWQVRYVQVTDGWLINPKGTGLAVDGGIAWDRNLGKPMGKLQHQTPSWLRLNLGSPASIHHHVLQYVS